jgi:hypothetical protein
MARSADTPFPPRLSIARLGEVWDVGVNKRQFIEVAVGHLLRGGRRSLCWVVGRGLMPLPDYLRQFDEQLGRHNFAEYLYRQIAEEVMRGPADIPDLAATFDVPLPSFLDAWKRGTLPSMLRRPRGRRSRRDEIIAEYGRLTPAERAASHEAVAALIRERLGGGAGLSDTAIYRALGWRK